jgi:hypothetical protein
MPRRARPEDSGEGERRSARRAGTPPTTRDPSRAERFQAAAEARARETATEDGEKRQQGDAGHAGGHDGWQEERNGRDVTRERVRRSTRGAIVSNMDQRDEEPDDQCAAALEHRGPGTMQGDEGGGRDRARAPAQGHEWIEQLAGGESVPQQPDVEEDEERSSGPAGRLQHPPRPPGHTAARAQNCGDARHHARKPAGLEPTTHRGHYSDEPDRRRKDLSATR